MPPPAMGLFKTWIPFGSTMKRSAHSSNIRGALCADGLSRHVIEKKLRARLFIPVEVPDYRNSTCEDRVAPSSKIMDTSVSPLR